MIHLNEAQQTIDMIAEENLDIRTITMGISLLDCCDTNIDKACEKVYQKITHYAKDLVATANQIEKDLGIPIVNKRISVTPIAHLVAVSGGNPVKYAKALDRAAKAVQVDFIGGFTALVHKGMAPGDEELIQAIPEALQQTERVCSSVNIGSTRAGINLDAVKQMGNIVREAAELTKDNNSLGASKLVIFCNAVEDNPFMAGSFLGAGEADVVLNVGVSGPGVVNSAVRKLSTTAPINEVAECVKKLAFKITRMGQLVGKKASEQLHIPFGIVDISLAPTPAPGDSVARILEAMGLEQVGTHGTVAALALLNDAVKKGGAMAAENVGGLSGAFIPVSEDEGMIAGVESGSLSFDMLTSMTSVCSVGLDMIVVPGDTPAETISAMIADEAAIGMINHKATAVRVIPAIGKTNDEALDFGGLFGYAKPIPIHSKSSADFINRGGHIPAPINSLKN
ncbi:hypothetical protein SAMN04487984_0136 [Aerococcus suis]|uniref:UPF0210 protein SAMN04487984_0136 n=1 Tax=Aerococcus suis TaxID=371602 RepID=A0A1W1Y3J5_9LACT|nr:PFL family protein [Aerococcus suis]SMC30308.1 hypothetical protein SAMN04487984_0136 [Aerococcus suis]